MDIKIGTDDLKCLFNKCVGRSVRWRWIQRHTIVEYEIVLPCGMKLWRVDCEEAILVIVVVVVVVIVARDAAIEALIDSKD